MSDSNPKIDRLMTIHRRISVAICLASVGAAAVAALTHQVLAAPLAILTGVLFGVFAGTLAISLLGWPDENHED